MHYIKQNKLNKLYYGTFNVAKEEGVCISEDEYIFLVLRLESAPEKNVSLR